MCNIHCIPEENIHVVLDYFQTEESMSRWMEDLPYKSFVPWPPPCPELQHHKDHDLPPNQKLTVLELTRAEAELPGFARERGYVIPVLITVKLG